MRNLSVDVHLEPEIDVVRKWWDFMSVVMIASRWSP
jgi:hypothetical protein